MIAVVIIILLDGVWFRDELDINEKVQMDYLFFIKKKRIKLSHNNREFIKAIID